LSLSNFDLDDIPEDDLMSEPKKKVNGKKKGSRYELEVAKDLSARYKETFRRVPQSGAIVGGLNRIYNEGLREDAAEILAGDIICPKWFPFSVECKNYANSPKIHNLLSIGDKDLDKWIKQAKGDAEFAKKEWLIFFKVTTGRKSYACLDMNKFAETCPRVPNKYISYKGSIIIDYKQFLNDHIKNYFPDTQKSMYK
jgi:hypothetical protein